MRTRLLGLTAVAVLGLAAPLAVPASAAAATVSAGTAATAGTWRWGPVKATDRQGWAQGTIVATGSGLRIKGVLYDAGGKACSWLGFRYLSDKGKWKERAYRYCKTGGGSFSFHAGHFLIAKAKVCRGTVTRATGKCSSWKTIWSQGG